MFGGMLLDDIRRAMLNNNQIIILFEDLFPKGKFSANKRDSALAYYLQVFVNVRAKDLCYRYNSNIYKQTKQQGVRQTLCAITGGGKKKSKKPNKQNNTIADIEEPEIYPEEDVSPEMQHQSLQVLAEVDMDNGDKVCTDPETIEMIT